MHDEPLASGVIEVAETHPNMLRFPYPLSLLGEVSHVWGCFLFLGGLLTGSFVGVYWLAPWFFAWKAVSVATKNDYHMPNTVWVWLCSTAWDVRAADWCGTSVADNPRRWNVPKGYYDAV